MNADLIHCLERIADALELIAGRKFESGIAESSNASISEFNDEVRRLPTRMRKAILRSGAKALNEITYQKMIEVRNCGASTANAICEWANRIRKESTK
jgi:DNA polymerase/3'-5' exonuclease PolX